jgi:hypothetical protein
LNHQSGVNAVISEREINICPLTQKLIDLQVHIPSYERKKTAIAANYTTPELFFAFMLNLWDL